MIVWLGQRSYPKVADLFWPPEPPAGGSLIIEKRGKTAIQEGFTGISNTRSQEVSIKQLPTVITECSYVVLQKSEYSIPLEISV